MTDLHDLLERTSRTFALSIPLLPEPTRREVTVAYLLFRIADTFEDASLWTREKRMRALDDFCDALLRPGTDPAETVRGWAREVPVDHAGYLELLEEAPGVLAAFRSLGDEARALIRDHSVRTARGMAGFVGRTDEDGVLRLRTLQDLRDYCYVVAGIVGEMLTELFLLDRPALDPVRSFLRERAWRFGEGLQLVNILKDAAADADEGRSYLPWSVDRAEVFELARRDLLAATEYTGELQRAGAERGLLEFNALPVQLAWATLERVEEKGPGAKVSRMEVYRITRRMNRALDEGRRPVEPPRSYELL